MRSVYKPVPFSFDSFKTIKTSSWCKTLLTRFLGKRKGDLLCHHNNSRILPNLLKKRVLAYNGRALVPFVIKRSMLGLTLTNIIRTKRLGRSIHIVKKRKKKKGK